MKIIVLYDACASAELHHKLAITLPSKWLEQSADKVKELFVERYNKKFPESPLDDEEPPESPEKAPESSKVQRHRS